MTKKVAPFAAVIFIISLLLVIFIPKDKRIDELLVNVVEYKELKNNRTQNDDINVDILFDGNALVKDNDKTLYYSLVYGNSSANNPRITIDENYNISILGGPINDEQIENNKYLSLLIYNDYEYKEYELVCTTLPLLCLNTDSKDNITEEETEGNIYLFDNRENVRQRLVESKALFHIRGASSKQYDKKPYKISLIKDTVDEYNIKNKINLLGLRFSDEYILNAMYIDREKIREPFSANLWYESCAENNSEGIINGYKYEYVELIINGEYQGLYALGFKPDNEVFNIGPKDWCYRKISLDSSEFEIDLDNLDYVEGYEIKYNHQDYDRWDNLKEYLRILRTTDQNNYEKLLNYTDVDSSIDYYLFINLIQGIDNWIEEYSALNNMYLTYKNRNGKFLYTPWDLDRSWGLMRDGNDYYDDPSVNVVSKATAADVLLKYSDDYKEKLKNRYYELRQNEWSNESMTKAIKRYESEIYDSGAFNRDFDKWSENYMSEHNNENDKLSFFLEYVLKRLEYMDEFINNI